MRNLLLPCLTRARLAEYSAFRLPAVAVSMLPEHQREAARAIPGLTVEQIRTCERRGLFDAFYAVTRHSTGLGELRWKARGRRRGDPALYSMRDLMVARLVSWMLHDPTLRPRDPQGADAVMDCRWSMSEIVHALNREAAITATMTLPEALAVAVVRMPRTVIACCVDASTDFGKNVEPRHGIGRWYRIAWLGVGRDGPKIHKRLKDTTVTRWNQAWTPAVLHAKQQQEARGAM